MPCFLLAYLVHSRKSVFAMAIMYYFGISIHSLNCSYYKETA